ncbi:Glycosyl phosphatidyl inositol protein transamidase complex subunit [Scheffersomyces spartinae]|uniref:Glycosyl phosphatidyl inositol protein transamidase complex subunit n=1 Tax=Scheffersomyces spartinae TaxID=45513 RepID=A0A9P7VDJ7_9ASCO|nr:Glycosyl phosphatidyl inositol protein transamidase complex subunit [Scheffersomyces spartinae]KAG7195981.1 Glycosyl phosphatidyl inositol protein transamidase complex subunit [Scheffersomyces spartinae]
MALAEAVLRKVHKLGLVPKIVRLLPLMAAAMVIASIGSLMYLGVDGQYRNVYISENALMPSQVMSYFRESEWNIVRGYREEVSKLEDEDLLVRCAVVEGWFKKLGYVTSYYDDTLYAILHAPRGDDTEAMVLTVPWTISKSDDDEFNEGAIAIAVSMARYFKRMSIWSKNIIFTFPKDAQALRDWVEAYHTTLKDTAGSIDAAIVIEYGKNGDNFEYIEVDYEGLNGQLPNLDLINTLTNIAYNEGIHTSIQGTSGEELVKNTYGTRIRTLFYGLANLVLTGLKRKSGGCEAFSGWQIQAITIRAKGTKGPADVTQFGRLIDSTFRSVNNLLEKFHQSFFFYLMLSPKNFVSIGTYLPSAVLMALVFALSSLNRLIRDPKTVENISNNISNAIILYTCVVAYSFMVGELLPKAVLSDLVSAEVVPIYGMIFFLLVQIAMPSKLRTFQAPYAEFLHAIFLFHISMLIIALLIVHFALALFIALIALPLAFLSPVADNNTFKGYLLIFLANPFTVVFTIDKYIVPDGGIAYGLLTSYTKLQCWTWPLLIWGYFPAWLGIAFTHCLTGTTDPKK